MNRHHTALQAAAGQLISAIQKEWLDEIGVPAAARCEQIMHSAHELLQATKQGHLAEVLQGRSITQFLGPDWVQMHPRVQPFIQALATAATA
ncbi:MAG: hypothetical protein LBJ15_01365 [Comamonas sp.]|uniref:hypothetical protein n=1 Tax=Comamonas sp. TaxID=34028 RepID=UPI002820E1C1|nr:hypothetical protein [Comamonas sp.]MDR0212634.1 hypothetical protein [Comamonas sp.]MDR2297815.1 hypothetical protein [Comamonas sp.]